MASDYARVECEFIDLDISMILPCNRRGRIWGTDINLPRRRHNIAVCVGK